MSFFNLFKRRPLPPPKKYNVRRANIRITYYNPDTPGQKSEYKCRIDGYGFDNWYMDAESCFNSWLEQSNKKGFFLIDNRHLPTNTIVVIDVNYTDLWI